MHEPEKWLHQQGHFPDCKIQHFVANSKGAIFWSQRKTLPHVLQSVAADAMLKNDPDKGLVGPCVLSLSSKTRGNARDPWSSIY